MILLLVVLLAAAPQTSAESKKAGKMETFGAEFLQKAHAASLQVPLGIRASGRLPLFPLRGAVLFPGATIPLVVGRPKTVTLARQASGGGLVALLPLRTADALATREEDFFSVGVAARVVALGDRQGAPGVVEVAFQGLVRIRASKFRLGAESDFVEVEPLPDRNAATADPEPLRRLVREAVRSPQLAGDPPPEGWAELLKTLDRTGPGESAFLVAGNLPLPLDTQVQVLGEDDVVARLSLVEALLKPLFRR